MTEAFEGLSPGGCKYPGLPELPEELGSMPSLSRRMPAGMVRAGLMQLQKRLSPIEIADELRLRFAEKRLEVSRRLVLCTPRRAACTPRAPHHGAAGQTVAEMEAAAR